MYLIVFGGRMFIKKHEIHLVMLKHGGFDFGQIFFSLVREGQSYGSCGLVRELYSVSGCMVT